MEQFIEKSKFSHYLLTPKVKSFLERHSKTTLMHSRKLCQRFRNLNRGNGLHCTHGLSFIHENLDIDLGTRHSWIARESYDTYCQIIFTVFKPHTMLMLMVFIFFLLVSAWYK